MISVVVPTYNEVENIGPLVERLDVAFSGTPYEVVVVDDSSPDGTAEAAGELARRYPVRVLVRPGRFGLSSAVVFGARAARGDVVVVMDADLQHPPELAPILARAVREGEADLAVATRYGRGGGVAGWPAYRRLISRGATLLARLVLPEARALSDPESGFFAVRRSCLASVRPTGLYKILLDVLVQCRPERVVEVPYVFRPRRAGKSKLGVRHMADYLAQLMRLSGWRPFKFAAVGASGIAVAEAVLYALAGLPYYIAALAAIEVSLTTNYLLNRLWTFRGRGGGALEGWLKYHVATALGNAANYGLSNALVLAGASRYLAYIIGVLAGFVANYILSETWVFNRTREIPRDGKRDA
ncbi:MAG: glycosyltransferase family 2 protein [Thermoproteus sp.]